ncbi:hypothetical protein LCGC14_2066930, partial [marine sediment metagenome]
TEDIVDAAVLVLALLPDRRETR